MIRAQDTARREFFRALRELEEGGLLSDLGLPEPRRSLQELFRGIIWPPPSSHQGVLGPEPGQVEQLLSAWAKGSRLERPRSKGGVSSVPLLQEARAEAESTAWFWFRCWKERGRDAALSAWWVSTEPDQDGYICGISPPPGPKTTVTIPALPEIALSWEASAVEPKAAFETYIEMAQRHAKDAIRMHESVPDSADFKALAVWQIGGGLSLRRIAGLPGFRGDYNHVSRGIDGALRAFWNERQVPKPSPVACPF